jgi:hypothetical protein
MEKSISKKIILLLYKQQLDLVMLMLLFLCVAELHQWLALVPTVVVRLC